MGAELLEALDAIWNTEEGKETIRRARNENDALVITYGSQIDASGYEMTHHHLLLSPDDRDAQNIHGEWYKESLLDVLSHELFHAADPSATTGEALAFHGKEHKAGGNDGILYRAEFKVFYEFEKKKSLVLATHLSEEMLGLDASALKAAIHEAIELHAHEIHRELETLECQEHCATVALYGNNPQIKTFVERMESPAIRFANRMAQSVDPQHVPRRDDYADSVGRLHPYVFDQQDIEDQMYRLSRQIVKHGSLESYSHHRDRNLEKYMAQLSPGALVRLQDIPQTHIDNDQTEGRATATSFGRSNTT